MRPRPLWVLILGTLILGTTAYLGKVQATPSAGFTATTLAVGRFGDINASSHVFFPDDSEGRNGRNLWLSFQKTKGPSDLYVQSNVWAPGGTTGWHTHPSHSLIIVTAGTLTAYDGDDPACTPHVYTAGMGLVDEGGDHTHVIRNEGSVEARTVAVQLIPAGATRRMTPKAMPPARFEITAAHHQVLSGVISAQNHYVPSGLSVRAADRHSYRAGGNGLAVTGTVRFPKHRIASLRSSAIALWNGADPSSSPVFSS